MVYHQPEDSIAVNWGSLLDTGQQYLSPGVIAFKEK
jgi:hypothetical protein